MCTVGSPKLHDAQALWLGLLGVLVDEAIEEVRDRVLGEVGPAGDRGGGEQPAGVQGDRGVVMMEERDLRELVRMDGVGERW